MKLLTLISSLLLCSLHPLPAMSSREAPANSHSSSPATSRNKNQVDELSAARAFIQAKEKVLSLSRQPSPNPKDLEAAQEKLRQARLALQSALLQATAQDLSQSLERSGERAKELLEKTTQESTSLLRDLLQQIEKVIPSEPKE
ncbi:MAG: hypothetical protein NZM04_10200 [Methylacidiphilales bacterium]|nr:hypothetical protein [Candidatus Methylacidiphilales bacterium]MDW8349752.1 hypothetical protein [Verrucomicrobiae bacterium]